MQQATQELNEEIKELRSPCVLRMLMHCACRFGIGRVEHSQKPVQPQLPQPEQHLPIYPRINFSMGARPPPAQMPSHEPTSTATVAPTHPPATSQVISILPTMEMVNLRLVCAF